MNTSGLELRSAASGDGQLPHPRVGIVKPVSVVIISPRFIPKLDVTVESERNISCAENLNDHFVFHVDTFHLSRFSNISNS